LFPGGINTGQIWSKRIFKPTVTGYTVYAFEVRMKIPTGPGQGRDIYSIKSNPWTWRPGLNFSADYHNYQTFWTPNSLSEFPAALSVDHIRIWAK